MLDIKEDNKSLERTLRSKFRLVTARMNEVRLALDRAEKFMPDLIEMLISDDGDGGLVDVYDEGLAFPQLGYDENAEIESMLAALSAAEVDMRSIVEAMRCRFFLTDVCEAK